MPYVNIGQRGIVDDAIDSLVLEANQHVDLADRQGLANYVITRVVLGMLKPKEGWGYRSLSDVIKTLECAKAEVYRRLLAPYEDNAAARNGDLTEFGV